MTEAKETGAEVVRVLPGHAHVVPQLFPLLIG